MNPQVGAQWVTGLPPWFEKRIQWQQLGGVAIGLADRPDLIFLKLYAVVDSEGPRSVHHQDLLALLPSEKELAAAARWVKLEDTSAEFSRLLEEVLDHVSLDQEESR